MGFKPKPVTITEIFADNLRRECQRFPSIAEFCRKARINRQQFNRYLAAQNLPNPVSLHKICTTLGVSELSLFAAPQTGKPPRQPAAPPVPDALSKFLPQLPAPALAALSQAANTLLNHAGNRGMLLPGVYLAYMPLAGFPGQIICTALKISTSAGLTVFTRRTSFRTAGEKQHEYTVGKHMGLVLADAAATTFVGINKIFPHELSVMRVMHSVASAGAPILGLSVVRSPWGELACKVVVMAQGHGSAAERTALSRVGILKSGDPLLPAHVRQHLTNLVLPEAQAHDYVAVNEVLQVHQHLTARPLA